MDMDRGAPRERQEVSRVVAVGHALYALLPSQIVVQAGVKKGDRLAIKCRGGTIYAVRIPFEDLLSRKRPNWGDGAKE
jgi:hypothetical protein